MNQPAGHLVGQANDCVPALKKVDVMDIVAELTPSAPLLAVQHAARTLRIGGWTRLTGVGVATDVVAAEPMMADGDVLFLVACRAAACSR